MGSRIVSRIVAVLRLGFAVLAAYTLAYAANRAATAPRGVGMVDFFSYFTILSNISATIALAVGGVALLRGRGGLPDGVRGAVTSYMTVTGIIYAVVLRADAQEAGDLARWVDDVVHVVMPLVVFLDWLVVPPRVRQPYSILRYWLVFPVVYTVYSLIRGHFADWYPYPFLDPRGRGYGHVALECCVIAVVIAGVCLLVVWLGRFLRGKVSSDVMM
ncbi:MAG TPA: Pr6Pr family membrane protein [Actinospica sp.]|nr:Pr6Pr family membrane protein [Actinospica sp.]